MAFKILNEIFCLQGKLSIKISDMYWVCEEGVANIDINLLKNGDGHHDHLQWLADKRAVYKPVKGVHKGAGIINDFAVKVEKTPELADKIATIRNYREKLIRNPQEAKELPEK